MADEGFLGLVLKQTAKDQVTVASLASGANAQKQGVKEGDIIVSINTTPVTKTDQLIATVKAIEAGSAVKLKVNRSGKEILFNVLLVSRKEFLGEDLSALVGKPLPDFKGTDLKTKKPFSLHALKGKPVVLELWATWCPACVANIPELMQLVEANQDKAHFAALSFEEPQKIEKFLKSRKISYPIISSTASQVDFRFINGSIPKFLILDSQGNLVAIKQRALDLQEVLSQTK